MKVICHLGLIIRLLLIRIRVHAAKKRVLSGIQNSRTTTVDMNHSYKQFIRLSSKQERLAVAMRRIVRKNTSRPILRVQINPGYISVSPKAQKKLTDFEKALALTRHRNGDWGEPSTLVWNENNDAVCSGKGKLLSRYSCQGGGFFLIETDLGIPKTNIRLGSECI